MNDPTSITTYTSTAGPTTLKDIEKSIEALAAKLARPCWFAEQMRRQDADPDKGWLMYLPDDQRAVYGDNLPEYVRYSSNIVMPILINGAFLLGDVDIRPRPRPHPRANGEINLDPPA